MKEERVKISLEQLPKIKFKNKEIVDFYNLAGIEVDYSYENIKGTIKIIKTYIKRKARRIIFENNEEVFDVNYDTSFTKGNFTRKIIGSSYRFNIGETVNGLQILNRKIHQINDTAKRKFYLVKCLKCGYISEKWKEEQSIINGNKCPVCCTAPKVTIEGLNDITTTDPWMIPYFQGGYEEAKLYTSGSNKRIFPICPYCKTIKDKSIKISSIRTNKGISCICGDGFSYPNKLMYNILILKNIKFISEYSPEWVGKYRYDFYIPSKHIIIEMDGGLGHGNKYHRGYKTQQELKDIDNYKDYIADKNGLKVYRIDCKKNYFNYISENILKSDIAKILDISENNLINADKKSYSNIVYDVCKYKNNHLSESLKNIANVFGIHIATVCRYLKIGYKYGWVDKLYIGNGNPLIVYKDGRKIGYYSNSIQASELLKKDFGYSISHSNIRNLRNKQKTNRDGYSFKSIDNKELEYYKSINLNLDFLLPKQYIL